MDGRGRLSLRWVVNCRGGERAVDGASPYDGVRCSEGGEWTGGDARPYKGADDRERAIRESPLRWGVACHSERSETRVKNQALVYVVSDKSGMVGIGCQIHRWRSE